MSSENGVAEAARLVRALHSILSDKKAMANALEEFDKRRASAEEAEAAAKAENDQAKRAGEVLLQREQELDAMLSERENDIAVAREAVAERERAVDDLESRVNTSRAEFDAFQSSKEAELAQREQAIKPKEAELTRRELDLAGIEDTTRRALEEAEALREDYENRIAVLEAGALGKRKAG